MTRAARAAAALAAAALIAVPALAASSAVRYPENPPLAHTGGFGEPTCHACHFESPPIADSDALSVTGIPAQVAPGEAYPLEVRLTSPGMRRAGFQLAIRFAEGKKAGGQAGTLASADDRAATGTSETDSLRIMYAHHTRAGTALTSTDTAIWRLVWTAPESAARIMIHVVANAANDDASEFGDIIHTRSYAIEVH